MRDAEQSGETRPIVDRVFESLERLNPPDQLNRLMLMVNMPPEHRPADSITLFRRETAIVDWAAGFGAAGLAKFETALEDLVAGQNALLAEPPDGYSEFARQPSTDHLDFLQGLPARWASQIDAFLLQYLGTPENPVPFGGWDDGTAEQDRRSLQAGRLTLRVGTVLPLKHVRFAHEMLAGAPHQPGKIVLNAADRSM